ncbi:MAG TPA: TonB family protein [Nitrospira sp.]|nr:TonB family protein [Nitrospira sp.]
MQRIPQRTSNASNTMATGWLLSCLLHGGAVIAAIMFSQHIHLAPQEAPFQWDVAMETPALFSGQAAAPQEQPVPATLRHPSPTLPAKRTHAAGPPVQQATSSPTVPITELAPPPQQIEPLPNEPMTPPSISPLPTSSTSQPELSPEHTVVPHTNMSESPVSPPDTPPVSDASSASNSQVASAGTQRSTSVDYGWLATLMAQWIEGLDKRYPATLRAEGIEGRVTLVAILHADGSLSDVHIAKGSGNATLDQVALEDVRNGPPVKLVRLLERPQISVKFAISYDLKMAR